MRQSLGESLHRLRRGLITAGGDETLTSRFLMSWRVVVRPQVEEDVTEAVAWYDTRQEGLGAEFREAVIHVFDTLAVNPLPGCRRHPRKNIRWRYPDRLPYRVIYEVIEEEKIGGIPQ